jgi:hypothetical protein
VQRLDSLACAFLCSLMGRVEEGGMVILVQSVSLFGNADLHCYVLLHLDQLLSGEAKRKPSTARTIFL